MTVLPKRSSQNRLRFVVDRFHCRAHPVQAARPIDQPDEDRRAPAGQELAQRPLGIARRAGCFLERQGHRNRDQLLHSQHPTNTVKVSDYQELVALHSDFHLNPVFLQKLSNFRDVDRERQSLQLCGREFPVIHSNDIGAFEKWAARVTRIHSHI